MGKSTKKSATKVDAAPAVASPAKTMKKGKREAEEVTEKLVAAKKQKTANGAVAQPVEAKKKVEAKVQKKIPKKEESSSSDSDESSSDSEMEEQKVDTLKKGPRDVKLPPKGASDTSEESSEEDSDSSSDEEPEPVVPPKKETVPAAKTVADDSSSDDSDSESEEDEEPKKKAAVPSAKEATPAVKNSIVTAPKKESESSDESSSDESSDEDDAKPTSQPTKVSNVDVKNGVAKAKEETSDSSSEESDSDEEMTDKATQPKLVGAAAKKPSGDVTKKKEETSESSEEESSSDESDSDGEKAKAVDTKKTVSAPASNKKPVTEDDEDTSSESDEEDSSEEEDEQPAKTPKKKSSDVEMVDAPSAKTTGSLSEKKTPQTPSTPQTGGSKTLFVGNLPFSVEEEDVREFFKDAGEIVEVRFAMRDEKFAGYGHVEFTTEEAAQKALELNGKLILNSRAVRLDLARERGAYTPASGRNESFQKGGRSQGQTVFVRGFDNTDTEDNIRNKLEEHFGKCGEISRVSIPKDYDSGSVKGFAYIDFQDKEAFSKALELNGSEFGEDMYLTVDEAKPRGDSREGFGRGGGRRGGGRSGGRDGGGRFGGRDGGGRFGGGRSGGRSGGRRGGRTPNRPSMATAGTGKKTTFGDD